MSLVGQGVGGLEYQASWLQEHGVERQDLVSLPSPRAVSLPLGDGMWAPYSTPPSLAQLFHLRSSKLQHPAVSAVKPVLWKKSSLGRERPWIQVTKGGPSGSGTDRGQSRSGPYGSLCLSFLPHT